MVAEAPRGQLQRDAVLQDIMRTVPPEVAGQLETLVAEEVASAKPKPRRLHRASTQQFELPTAGAPSDITMQKRCSSLEQQLHNLCSILCGPFK